MTFHDSDSTTHTVTPEATVRWLGVHFDQKLHFRSHAKLLAAREEHTVNGLCMLANTVRGLSHIHLRRLYLAYVIPKILYACPVWWSGTKYQSKPLEKVQRRALTLICAAFKTTPIAVLEIEASIPSIKLQVNLHKKRCAICLNKLSQSSPIIQRLPDAWRDNEGPTQPPPLPTCKSQSRSNTRKSTRLIEIAKLTDLSHERIDPFLVAS